MRSAQMSGDSVTEAEIDAAIDQYLSTLHTFRGAEAGTEESSLRIAGSGETGFCWPLQEPPRRQVGFGISSVSDFSINNEP